MALVLKPIPSEDHQCMMLGKNEGRLYDLNDVDYTALRFVAAISMINSNSNDHTFQATSLAGATLNDRFLFGVKAFTGDAFPGNGVPFFGVTNNLDGGASKLQAGAGGTDPYTYEWRTTNYWWQTVTTANDGDPATEDYQGLDGFGGSLGKHDGAIHDGVTTGGAAFFLGLEVSFINKGTATQELLLKMKKSGPQTFAAGTSYSVEQLHAWLDAGGFSNADDAFNQHHNRPWVTTDGGSAALPAPRQIMLYNPFGNPRISLSGFACRIIKD